MTNLANRTCGLIGTYQAGCRCADCRAAAAEKRRKYRAKQRQGQPAERKPYTRAPRPVETVRPLPDLSWHEHKACRPEDWGLFFPETGTQYAYARPRAICAVCRVRDACLSAALVEERGQIATRRHGMRGGLTPAERVEWEKAQDRVPEAEPGGLFCGRDPAELLAKPHVCAVDGCRCGR